MAGLMLSGKLTRLSEVDQSGGAGADQGTDQADSGVDSRLES